MTKPGPKPKPTVVRLREGNPGNKTIQDSAKLPPSALREPNWDDYDAAIRSDAASLWKQLAPVLSRAIGLVGEQQVLLEDYCICVARIRQGERILSRDGVVVDGLHGTRVKHPWTTVLGQYRQQFRTLTGELGLSPASLSRIPPAGGSGDDDDPFD